MSQPVKLPSGYLPHEVYVYRTRTGEVIGSVPLSDRSPDFEFGINMAGSWSAYPTIDVTALTAADLTAWSVPWDMSWAVCQGTKIWQAGPVLGERYTAGQNSTQIYGVGLWQLLYKRTLFNPTRSSVGVVTGADADVSFGTGSTSDLGAAIPAANQNLNLRGVAKRLVELLLAEPGGNLPIDISTTGSFTGSTVQNYPGYEFSTYGDRLNKVTDLVDGVEIVFEPYFPDATKSSVRHLMKIGNNRLGQLGYPHIWRSGEGLVKLDFAVDGTDMARRVWQRGDGTDRTTNTAFSQDLTGVTTGRTAGLLPLLETVDTTHMNASVSTTLQAYADGALATSKAPLLTLSPTVRLDGGTGAGFLSGSPSMQSVFPGDTGILQVRGHPRLPDGDYGIRIVRIRGDSPTQATMDVVTL